MLTFLVYNDVIVINLKLLIMTSKFTILLLLLSYFSFSQQTPSRVEGGEYKFNQNGPCLTNEDYVKIFNQLKTSRRTLMSQNEFQRSTNDVTINPSFIWPVQKANHVTINDVWAVSNYVDQNQNPNAIEDYNCDQRTYDAHQGVDIFTWPFGWKMMEENDAEIIAAAPGIIRNKFDGNSDRSCDPVTAADWNAVYIEHDDGSVALYGHMKINSLTTKAVGETVSQGEYLGIVGSSGRSSGPHLHFEVFDYLGDDVNGDPIYDLIDPYYLDNNCNDMNTSSWWQSQKPYNNPRINALLTHTTDPVFSACPTTTTTNESNQFNISQEVIFTLFLKDQAAGTSVNLRIIRPDNTDLFNWNFDLANNHVASWYRWNSFPNVNGEWKWQATYAGETVTHAFNVGVLGVEENEFSEISIYPNPFNDIVNINSKTKIKSASVIDALGKVVVRFKENSFEGIKELNLSQLSNGLYFVTLEGKQNQKKTIKLIKK